MQEANWFVGDRNGRSIVFICSIEQKACHVVSGKVSRRNCFWMECLISKKSRWILRGNFLRVEKILNGMGVMCMPKTEIVGCNKNDCIQSHSHFGNEMFVAISVEIGKCVAVLRDFCVWVHLNSEQQ